MLDAWEWALLSDSRWCLRSRDACVVASDHSMALDEDDCILNKLPENFVARLLGEVEAEGVETRQDEDGPPVKLTADPDRSRPHELGNVALTGNCRADSGGAFCDVAMPFNDHASILQFQFLHVSSINTRIPTLLA